MITDYDGTAKTFTATWSACTETGAVCDDTDGVTPTMTSSTTYVLSTVTDPYAGNKSECEVTGHSWDADTSVCTDSGAQTVTLAVGGEAECLTGLTGRTWEAAAAASCTSAAGNDVTASTLEHMDISGNSLDWSTVGRQGPRRGASDGEL